MGKLILKDILFQFDYAEYKFPTSRFSVRMSNTSIAVSLSSLLTIIGLGYFERRSSKASNHSPDSLRV